MEQKKTKTKIAVTISTVITAAAISITSFAKLFKAPILVASFTRSGIVDHITLLGIITLALLVIYLYPKTMKLGFILFCVYFGGAISIDLLHGEPVIPPAIILALIWINAYLRNPEIFISTSRVFIAEWKA